MLDICLCDDDSMALSIAQTGCQSFFSDKGIDVNIECFSSGKELLEESQSGRFKLAVLDIDMPDINGIELADKLTKEGVEKRTALAIFPSTCLRSRSATALERDGIREEDRELATATGMLNSRWYFPEYTPQWAAISCPSPSTVFTWPNRMLSTTLTLL